MPACLPDSSAGKESACNAGDPGSIPGSGSSLGEGIDYPLQYSWASLVAWLVNNTPAMRETWVQSLGWEDPLEEGMATHSSILAWRIPWTQEPGGLQSMGSQKVGHSWMTKHSTQLEQNRDVLECVEVHFMKSGAKVQQLQRHWTVLWKVTKNESSSSLPLLDSSLWVPSAHLASAFCFSRLALFSVPVGHFSRCVCSRASTAFFALVSSHRSIPTGIMTQFQVSRKLAS